MLSKDSVRDLFSNLETGHSDQFFERVRDDVDWTVMGTHPLAGHYRSKSAFLDATFARLGKVLKDGVILKVVDLHVDGDVAIVELRALSTANNGKPFDNTYCWVCTFDRDGRIAKVRAYLDSALVAQLIEENE
ncbi:nuclear transport factor 2 family protein [Labrenzia sp. VG12]|uniref:nuclear transport factor 2 family protein n=1 Tax=Labrenzia sp. VG12 TaxID=2021862 RepID=UPI000B8C1D86|nr:nuclear transport factor 2 family protein [Labrenzia sp. VG12]ASP36868.1 ketosteroid isomerase [Labrenzia sp. VG12]